MAKNDELSRLRAEARRAHRNATSKISRLRNAHDVELTGTRHDPRIPIKRVDHYTTAQLKAYISRLDSFRSRSVQFVGDAQMRPVEASQWARYKNLERQYNASVNEQFNRVADVFVPRLGMTVREYMAMTTPDHRQMGNPAVNAPYAPPRRRPTNVASVKALQRLSESMEKRLAPGYVKGQIAESRKQFEQLVDRIGDDNLRDSVRALSDDQFYLLWNYTPFATAASFVYEVAMAELSGKQKAFHSDALRQFSKDTHALVEWVGTVNLGG